MKGYLQVYTGDGKGKSTAAFGLALRARGADLKVHLIQFIKNKLYSEIETLLKIGVTVRQFGCGLILGRPVSSQDIAEARKGLREIDRLFAEAAADVLILDEVNIALARGLLEETVFHSILDGRPTTMEVHLYRARSTGKSDPAGRSGNRDEGCEALLPGRGAVQGRN